LPWRRWKRPRADAEEQDPQQVKRSSPPGGIPRPDHGLTPPGQSGRQQSSDQQAGAAQVLHS
jgi:hypothetical protein